MTEHMPQAEIESKPEGGLLRFELMTAQQIGEAAIALTEHAEVVAARDSEATAERIDTCDSLMDGIYASMRDHAATNPVRARDLLRDFAHSDERALQRVAAYSVDSLLDFDYGFTRDTLTWLAGYNPQHPHYEGVRIEETAGMHAYGTIRLLMRDRLTPEQIDDFNASLVTLGSTPVDPLQPGEQR